MADARTLDGVPPWLEEVGERIRRERERQPPPAPDHMWTAEEVARFLNVSRSWVYERTMAGEIPSVRLGGLRRFEPAKVQAYAAGKR